MELIERRLKMTKKIRKTILSMAASVLFMPQVWAVRPFITDDAALIGKRRFELANWGYYSRNGLELWHSVNNGLFDCCELTVAGVWGFDNEKMFTGTFPLLQAKFLFRDYEPNGIPGITCAVGSNIPIGKGTFVASGHGVFAFTSITQCIGIDEQLLLHLQLGGTFLHNNDIDEKTGKKIGNQTGFVWGLGAQTKIYKGLHLVSELVQGDPYDAQAPMMYQLGIRQFVSDKLQFDFAFGGAFKDTGRSNLWVTAGVRYVLDLNKNSKYARNGRKI